MRRPLLFLMMVVGLVAASVVAIALRPATLGLDLQGGVEVVLQGQPSAASEVTDESIDRSIEIIRSRVDAFGVAEPEIQRQGDDQIIVSLPGVDDPSRVVNDLIKPAQLLLFDFGDALVGPETGNPSLFETVQLAQRTRPEDPSAGEAQFYAFDRETKRPVGQPAVDRQTLLESLPEGTRPRDVQIERVPRGLFIAFQETELQTREGAGGQRTWFLFQYDPKLTGGDITEARSVIEPAGIGEPEPVVTMQFTGEGRDKFEDVTADLARRGALRQQLQSFAIVLDGEIVTNPTVDYNDYPVGIRGDQGAQIQGDFSQAESQRLAQQLNSGAIPIELETISQQQVGATLGAESLREGLIAGVVGLVLVLGFMIAYYRFLGVVASVALIVYAVMLYAVAVLVPITLTLPGIAGIILTIGVASDANVVIFERVREEARAGRSPKAAIQIGYRKGISAIIDANVVTLATAAILFLLATAGVKGFAFTLFIGVILSLLTAVVATRAVFGVLAETRFLRDERFMGLRQREIRWKMDFVGRWRLWMAISFVPLAIGTAYIAVNGLNLGLDFESGTRLATSFERPASEEQLRGILQNQGIEGAKIQATTEVVDGREVEGFQIQTETLTPGQVQAVERALDADLGLPGDEFESVNSVGATFGAQIIDNAILAIVLSFLVLVAYLTIRFEYKLALPALISVIHDVGIAVAVYSVTGREVTSATVAALLTILGYSLYDVVIVFDRIRENVPLLRNMPYRQVVNRSVHETLTRSVITSLTTLIPLTVLFFFGGDTLKDFAFALLVGILSGSLSSVAIAAPLAALWKEREPEQRRRTAKAERRALKVTGDADVVDLDVLARAEMALRADLDGPRADDERARLTLEDEVYEDDEVPTQEAAAEPKGIAAPARAATDAPPAAEPVGEGQPVPPAEQDTPAPRRPAPSGVGGERVRRHRQVQRKRRR